MEIDREEMGSKGNVVIATTSVSRVKLGRHFPEWLLTEVLVRLPVKLVFRSKLVSKEWLSFISDPSFVRMYASQASKLQPWTFICNDMHVEDSRSWGFCKDDLVVDGNDFKRPGFFLLPSPPCAEHQRPHPRYNVVGVSNGLVLCGSRLHEQGGLGDSYRYSICNPITWQRINLPYVSPARNFNIFNTGFLTEVENGILTSYRVVCLGLPSKRSTHFRFDVFFPEIGEWKEFTVRTDQEVGVISYRSPTALNGILHWITLTHEIIAYDPYHNLDDHLHFIALPGDCHVHDEDICDTLNLLDVHQGRLRYFACFTPIHYNPHDFSGCGVWLQNDCLTGWCLQYRINYADILFGGRLIVLPISFHPFDTNIVYLWSKDKIASFNMKTGKYGKCGGDSLDVEDIIGQTRCITTTTWRQNQWWLTFLFMIPTWPIYIPVPSFES